MNKINLMILMVVLTISVYSMDATTLVRINIMEKKIEKKFIICHSQIFNDGKLIDCEVEVDLFEKSGLVRLICKNVVEINELIAKSESGFFDGYFKKIVCLVNDEVMVKNYKINLIFVSKEENKLIAKRCYDNII